MVNENLITVRDAARISGYSTEYIRKLIHDGLIAAQKYGFNWLIDRDSLERYAKEQGKVSEQR